MVKELDGIRELELQYEFLDSACLSAVIESMLCKKAKINVLSQTMQVKKPVPKYENYASNPWHNEKNYFKMM